MQKRVAREIRTLCATRRELDTKPSLTLIGEYGEPLDTYGGSASRATALVLGPISNR